MNRQAIAAALTGLPLGDVRYLDRVGSTNDLALAWVDQGAPHLSVVIADEQTAGRGRAGRRWHTPPGSALAFSVILRPGCGEARGLFPRLAGLGALAVCAGLADYPGLAASVKWPNDVLLGSKKVAGVLAEGAWMGNQAQVFVLGIGINITPGAVPPADRIDFPATCVEDAFGAPVDRIRVLRACLAGLAAWWPRRDSEGFLRAWENALAFREERLRVSPAEGRSVEGRIVGLDRHGYLKLSLDSGDEITLTAGALSLRPVDTPQK